MHDRDYSRAQRAGLAACTLAQTVSAASILSLGPLAALIQSDLALTRTELGLVLAAGSVGAALTAVPAGWLTDRLGVRRVVFAGMVLGGLALCLVALSSSLAPALAMLALAGVATGVIPGATTKAIMYWFSVRVRGTAMGLKQTGFPIGGALAAGILPAVALAAGGWRSGIAVVGLFALASSLLYLWLYTEHPQQHDAPPGGPVTFEVLRLLATDRRLVALAILGLCYGYNLATLSGYLSLYLHETLGMEIVLAGAYLMGSQISGAVGRLGLGVISDRLFGGRRAPVLLGVTVMNFVVALGFGWLMPGAGTWGQVVLVLALGMCAIGWSSLFHVFVGETAGREKAGTAMGLCLMFMAGGNVVGPPLFGLIVDVSQSYPLAWLSQAFASAAGVVLILFIRRWTSLGVATWSGSTLGVE